MFRLGVALLCLLGPATTWAAPDKLIFALRPLPPYMEVTPTGYAGSHVEIMARLAERLNVKLEIVECPLVRCLRMLQEGTADVTMGLAMTAEREPMMVLLEPPYAAGSPTYFFLRRDDKRKVRKYEDLYPLRLGVIRGLHYFDEFDGDNKLKKDEAPDLMTNFRKLVAGRVDVVPAGANVAATFLQNPQFAGRVKAAEWVRPNKVMRYVSMSRTSPWQDERGRLEQALAAMVDAGETRAILERYETAFLAACKKARRC